jgi:16S rRNA processing protein RimM
VRGRGKHESSPPHPSRAALSLDARHPLPQGERGRVLVARFGAPHGVRGEIKLWSFTEDPLAIADYGPLETADGRTFEIESLRPAKDFLVARVAGVNDRAAAEALRNVELYVPRERLPAIEDEDTWYYSDLVGLFAFAAEGDKIGTVTAVHNFGAGEVIEIAPVAGGPTIMLPFTEPAVPEVNVKAGRMVVVLPSEDDDVARVGSDHLS